MIKLGGVNEVVGLASAVVKEAASDRIKMGRPLVTAKLRFR